MVGSGLVNEIRGKVKGVPSEAGDAYSCSLDWGYQWGETRGIDFCASHLGVLWQKLGIPVNGVQMGNGCALFKGVLIDVMLSIPLIQGTKRGIYLMARDICNFAPSVDWGSISSELAIMRP